MAANILFAALTCTSMSPKLLQHVACRLIITAGMLLQSSTDRTISALNRLLVWNTRSQLFTLDEIIFLLTV